jgi:UDP-N-acetylmuramoyl-L-alanyl-D-glutamate--2,6-diaminopimelate ligase
MDNYFAAKRLLFAPEAAPPPRWSVINADDARVAELQPSGGEVLRYGFADSADLQATDVETTFAGLRFTVQHRNVKVSLASSLMGRINVYNILAACGASLSYGFDWNTIAAGIADLKRVPGRFETVKCGQPFLVAVDYAHTDDAIRNVIAVARELKPRRVITLFGCGGDRDRTKRPLMAMAAAGASDYVVLTSDNPRSEDPIAIMNDALVGLRRFDTPHLVEPDRAKAIRAAIGQADSGDLVLLCGKGHEPYQILKDRVIHFDDREVAAAVLKDLGYEG